jgi:hypothetical protein
MMAISNSLMRRMSATSRLVGDLARRGGQQHERQDEHGADQVHDRAGVDRAPRPAPKVTNTTNAFLNTLSFAAPGELRPEERREARWRKRSNWLGCTVGIVHGAQD